MAKKNNKRKSRNNNTRSNNNRSKKKKNVNAAAPQTAAPEPDLKETVEAASAPEPEINIPYEASAPNEDIVSDHSGFTDPEASDAEETVAAESKETAENEAENAESTVSGSADTDETPEGDHDVSSDNADDKPEIEKTAAEPDGTVRSSASPKQTDSPKNNKKRNVIIIIIILVVLLAAAGAYGINYYRHQRQLEETYNNAITLYANGEYEQAKEMFDQLPDYEDAGEWSAKCTEEIEKEQERADLYAYAVESFDAGDFEEAVNTFYQLGDYKDSAELAKKAQNYQDTYDQLEELEEKGRYKELSKALKKLRGYIPKSEYKMYYGYIREYGPWVGSFTYYAGDAKAVSGMKSDVSKFKTKMQDHELIIVYGKEKLKLEDTLNSTEENDYKGLYFTGSFDEYNIYAYRNKKDNSIMIKCEMITGEFDEFNGYYSKDK